MRNMMSKTVLWLGSKPDKCDVCGTKIVKCFVDGKTYYGSWGRMCPDCHKEFGRGTGLGRGQVYELQGTDWVKVQG